MKADWKKVKLGELITIKHGYAFEGEHIIQEDNGNVLVTPGNFKIGGGFQQNKCKFFNGNIPEEYILNHGDLIVTMTDLSKTIDTLGYSAIVPASCSRKYLHNQRIGLVNIINEECDKNYLCLAMQTHEYQKSIAGSSTGATVHHTSPSKIYDVKISLPSLETQQKIASILFAYDDLIENNRKQIKLLEEAAQRLYKEWFVDLRFQGYENVAIVDGLPEGWRKEKLGDWCKVFTGKKNANQNIEKGLYPFFTCAPEPLLSNDSLYTGKAVIISGNGSYTGRTQFYDGSFDLYQRTYACVKQKDIGYEYLPFIYYTMKILFEPIKMGGTKGAAIPYIVMADITDTLFLYNDRICKQYSFISENILDKIGKLKRQIQLLQQARDKLLPRLMSGEMEV